MLQSPLLLGSLIAALACPAGAASPQAPAQGAPRAFLDHLDVHARSVAFDVAELHAYLPRAELAALSSEGLWFDRLLFAPLAELAATDAVDLSLATDSLAAQIEGRSPEHLVDRTFARVHQHDGTVTKLIRPTSPTRRGQIDPNIERETPHYYLDYEPANRQLSLFEPGHFVAPFSLREVLRPLALGPNQAHWLGQREWVRLPDDVGEGREAWSFGHQDGLGAATVVLESDSGRLLAIRSTMGLVEGALPSVGIFAYAPDLAPDEPSYRIPETGFYLNPSETSVHVASFELSGLEWGRGELPTGITIQAGVRLFDMREHPTRILADLPPEFGESLHDFLRTDATNVSEAGFARGAAPLVDVHSHDEEPPRDTLRWVLLAGGLVCLVAGAVWSNRRG